MEFCQRWVRLRCCFDELVNLSLDIFFFTPWKVDCRLRTSLCLQFKPHHIAAGAIFLAAKFLKVKLPSDGEKVWWQEFDVTPRQLEGWSLLLFFCTQSTDFLIKGLVSSPILLLHIDTMGPTESPKALIF